MLTSTRVGLPNSSHSGTPPEDPASNHPTPQKQSGHWLNDPLTRDGNVPHRLPHHSRVVKCLVPFFSQYVLCLQGFHLGLPICGNWCLFRGNCLLRFQPVKTLGVCQRGLLRLALSAKSVMRFSDLTMKFPARLTLHSSTPLSDTQQQMRVCPPSTASASWRFTNGTGLTRG